MKLLLSYILCIMNVPWSTWARMQIFLMLTGVCWSSASFWGPTVRMMVVFVSCKKLNWALNQMEESCWIWKGGDHHHHLGYKQLSFLQLNCAGHQNTQEFILSSDNERWCQELPNRKECMAGVKPTLRSIILVLLLASYLL